MVMLPQIRPGLFIFSKENVPPLLHESLIHQLIRTISLFYLQYVTKFLFPQISVDQKNVLAKRVKGSFLCCHWASTYPDTQSTFTFNEINANVFFIQATSGYGLGNAAMLC